MTENIRYRIDMKLLAKIGIVACLAASLPASALAQRDKGGQRASGGGGQRSGGSGGQVHANRDAVRTRNFVGRSQGGSFKPQAPARQFTPRRSPPTNFTPTRTPNQPVRRPGVAPRTVQNQRTFTKTPQGRNYDNGMILRKGVKVNQTWQRSYFPHGYVHFPFYHPGFIRGQCYISPFAFYFGVCVPYIDVSACAFFPPATVFCDSPVYNGNTCAGFQDLDNGNLINDPNLDQNEPGLNNALDDLFETFQGGNIDGIVSVINPNMRIAIFERGQYQYSLSADDFTDMTRDAIQNTQNVEYSLDYLHQRSPTVFVVSGHQVYVDRNNNQRTVYLSYVLQDIGGLWTLSQVNTSPDVIQNF